MDLPVTALYGASSGGAILSLLNIIGSLMILSVFPFALLLIALVLYYFTGEKKKAEEFMPKLMAQSIRVFSYVWLLLISFGTFIGVTQVLFYVFANLLPGSRFFEEPDSQVLVQGLVLVLLMAVFAVGKVLLNRYSIKVSGVGGSVSTKLFITFGMIIFSILLFISSISVFMNVVDFIYDNRSGIDASGVAVMFSSLGFFSAYALKGIKVLQSESKKK